jgi:hypothetical protein
MAARNFGGAISNPRKRKPHHPVYTWQIVARDAQAFLQAVCPFLREKTEQALLLIALQQTMGLPLKGRKLDPEVLAEVGYSRELDRLAETRARRRSGIDLGI